MNKTARSLRRAARPLALAIVFVFGVLWAGTTALVRPQSSAGVLSRQAAAARARDLSALGRALFSDPSLSASGRQSCATCHDPAHAFASPRARAVEQGGADGRQPGLRAVPSLMYLEGVPSFTEHFFDESEIGSLDNGPAGGLTWDGRVDRASDQARLPLMSPFEMANDSAEHLRARVARGPHAASLVRLFGDVVLRDSSAMAAAIGLALETYEQEPADFYPYSSKYDAYLAGRAALTPGEARGLDLFEDPRKGNCASCHISRPNAKNEPPLFTDYGLIALGLPRNAAIPANADPSYYDLGLCGPLRTDLRNRPEYCGRFMTPTLRNVATRQVFFHNGAATSLTRAIAFYVERDVRPDRWYPSGARGVVRKFDDLPAEYWTNVESGAPFGGRPGDEPRLNAAEIEDIAAFLATLTDGTISLTARR
jgi:cytochrome c peroxidase